MPLNTDKAVAKELERIEAEGESAIDVEASTSAEGPRVGVEVSHTKSRWSVAAFGEWVRSKGWTAGGKAKIKLGD